MVGLPDCPGVKPSQALVGALFQVSTVQHPGQMLLPVPSVQLAVEARRDRFPQPRSNQAAGTSLALQ